MENEKKGVSAWDKVHAIGIFILGVAAIVMVGDPLIQRILPAAQPAPQPHQVISGYGLPPVQTIGGKTVSCAAPATYEDISRAFVCVCPAAKQPPIGTHDMCFSSTRRCR